MIISKMGMIISLSYISLPYGGVCSFAFYLSNGAHHYFCSKNEYLSHSPGLATSRTQIEM